MEDNRARVRYIRKEQPGLPGARNTGVAAAKGEVVLFVDDDVIPGPGLISAHARAYADGGVAGVAGVAGRVLPPGGRPTTGMKSPRRIAKVKFCGLVILDHFDADARAEAHHVRGCNMSFLKRAIERAGGFDVRFGGSAHLEETDLALRVRKLGYRLVFEPDAALVHLREPVGGCRPKSLREWFFWYGHNMCLFYLKNFPKGLFPMYVLYLVAKLPLSAIKNREPRIVPWAMSGLVEGISAYRRGAA